MPKTKAMTSIGRPNVTKLAGEAERALQTVAQKYGLKLTYKGGSYGSTQCALKFEFAVVNGDGIAETREAVDFRRAARLYGLEAEDLGRIFKSFAGDRFKIVGLSARAKRYPILAERVRDGARFKFPHREVQIQLGRNK